MKEDISEDIAKYDGIWSLEMPQRSILEKDFGLVLKSKGRHHNLIVVKLTSVTLLFSLLNQ